MSLARAQSLLSAGQLKEAEAALAAGERASYDPRRDIVLARICEARGDLARALDVLNAARQRLPDNAPVRVWHGMFALDAGLAEQAEAAFAESLALQPENDLARSYRALALLALGQTDEAVAIFRRYGFSDNRLFMVRLTEWMEIRWLSHGEYFAPARLASTAIADDSRPISRRQRVKKAERCFFAKDYQSLLAVLDPLACEPVPDGDILFACAIASEMLGDNERALEYLARFKTDAKGHDEPPDAILAARARNRVRLGYMEEAARELNRVLIIGPEDYGANYYLGVLCLHFGDRGRARRLFLRAYSDYIVDTLEYQFWQIRRALLA